MVTHYINGAEVRQVNITENHVMVIIYTNPVKKKAHNGLYFLRKLKKGKLTRQVLAVYRRAIESILSGDNPNWHGSCTDRKALQRVIKTAHNIIGAHLLSIKDIGVCFMKLDCFCILVFH